MEVLLILLVLLLLAVIMVSPALMIVFICLYISSKKKNKALLKRVAVLEKALQNGGFEAVQKPAEKPVSRPAAPVQAPVRNTAKPVFSYGNAPVQQNPVVNQRAAERPATQAQSVASFGEKPKKNSTINVILIIGVLFIVLSGFIFMTTTWNVISDTVRVIALLMMSLVFFGGSFIGEKFLDLKKTGFAFFCLGSVFLPISFFACGLFELFGEVFSPNAGSPANALFYFATFMLTSLTMAVGSVKYNSRFFSWVAYAAKTLTFIALVNCFDPTPGARALALSVYALIIVLVNGRVIEWLSDIFPKFDALFSQYELFSIINISAIALITLFTFESSFISALALFVIAGTFLMNLFNNRFPAGAFVFVSFIAIGFAKMSFGGGEWDNVIFKLSLSLIVCLALSMMGFIKEKTAKLMKLLTGIAAILFLVCNACFSVFAFDEASLPLIISSVIVYLTLVVASRNEQSKFLSHIHPFAFMLIAFESCAYLILNVKSLENLNLALYTALASLLGFALYKLIKLEKLGISFGTPTADIFFMVTTLVAFSAYENYLITLAAGVILAIQSVVSVITNKNSVIKKISALFAAYAVVFCSPLLRLDAEENPLTLSSYLIGLGLGCLLITAVELFIMKKDESSKAFALAAQVGLPVFVISHWSKLFDIYYPMLDRMLDDSKYVTLSDIKSYYLYIAGLMLFVIFSSAVIFFRYLKKSKEEGIPNKALTIYIVSAVFGFAALINETASYINALYSARNNFYFQGAAVGVILLAALAFILDKFAKAKDGTGEFVKDRFFKTMMAFSYLSAITLPFFIESNTEIYFHEELLKNPLKEYNFAVIFAIIALVVVSVFSFVLFWKKKETIWCLPLAGSLSYGIYKLCLLMSAAWLPIKRYEAIGSFQIDYAVSSFITAAALIGLSFLFFPMLYGSERTGERKKFYIDWFLPMGAFPILAIFTSADVYRDEICFAFCILSIGYMLSYIKKVYHRASQKTILTLSLLPFCCLFWGQPFFELLPAIELEFYMLPIAISLVLIYFIWREYKKAVGIGCFAVSAIMMIVLFIDGMDKGEPFDAVFLGLTAFVMLILSLWRKTKKWFMLSAVSLVALGVYMTREFWGSLDWWIYLAVIGITLIVMAALNEMARRDGRETIVKKIGKVFDGWDW